MLHSPAMLSTLISSRMIVNTMIPSLLRIRQGVTLWATLLAVIAQTGCSTRPHDGSITSQVTDSSAKKSFPTASTSMIGALIRADQWDQAMAEASALPDPVAVKLVTFYRALAPGAMSAPDIAAFMAANPGWPMQSTLARRRDQAIVAEQDNAKAASLCDSLHPALVDAQIRCAEAWSATGATSTALDQIRTLWAEGKGNQTQETLIRQKWSQALTAETRKARYQALLLTNMEAAFRQIPYLPASDRASATALAALWRKEPTALSLFNALSGEAKSSPVMVLASARYLRLTDHDQDAASVWKQDGDTAEQAESAAHNAAVRQERTILARALLKDGGQDNARLAFEVITGGSASTPVQKAESEFLAGFIALRFLHDPAVAENRFRSLLSSGNAVLTLSRAHYWLGEVAQARGDEATAKAEWLQAAAWPVTFYGQLGALQAGESPSSLGRRIRSLNDPGWSSAQLESYSGQELVRAALLLISWEESRRARAFLLQADEAEAGRQLPAGTVHALTAHLAVQAGLPDVAVFVARRMGRDGAMLPVTGWPPDAPVEQSATPVPLTLGIIRQESSFDPQAESPAGARGLMQLMPATASQVARTLGITVSSAQLLSDPALNVRLGSTYLQGLLDRFGQAVPLAVAGYNAGPHRVDAWRIDYASLQNAIDWIELIPFNETRNYVQRVIENTMVYRAKRNDSLTEPPLLSAPALAH
ncbi:lytic transglycosylase domain-containing protein [Granulibacter bethesdensis]|uniref:lytic transglycosylase domain-containing protein n=1 Tax=Granulibacter bethesdensis TaxID=364410 RepID=UPI00090C8606|nr:lytic transglycosylase domain-containing protein [Granulibacter bethesdensis]APH59519.1 Soluble lytic murein transglycosylase [Granulibacter bethesdensis]